MFSTPVGARPPSLAPAAPRLVAMEAPDFNLRLTVECGQIFHAMPAGDGWQILVGRDLLHAAQPGGRLHVTRGRQRLAANYFALDHPLDEIYRTFPADAFSRAALAACRGLRLIRQPVWECLATFITSPMKQVAHIREISLTLRARFGEPVAGSLANAYPEPSALAQVTEADLRACRLGFRAKSLLATARRVAGGEIDLASLHRMATPEAREALCGLPGVGRKVANCVLLFACERLDAVPVDVWIARVLSAMRRRKGSPRELEEYSHRRFGRYAGYIQQYLFHHARMSKSAP